MGYETYNGSGTWDILKRRSFPYDHYVHKTVTRLPIEGLPEKFSYWGEGVVNRVGLVNPGIEEFQFNIAPQIPAPFIASIYGRNDLEWGFLAEVMDGIKGVEAIEVNFSCPNLTTAGHMTRHEMRDAMEAMRKRTKKPIYAKLGPHHTAYEALECQNRGAAKIVCCNSLPTPRGGLSGTPIQTMVGELISSLVETETFKIPIIGMGGIQGPDDREGISHLLAAGADDIGIGSWNFSDECGALVDDLKG